VLELHGESAETWPASDALCAALQINNHLQDAAQDLRRLDRCYLPQDFLSDAGASVDDLARPAMSAPLRRVYDRILAETVKLNQAGTKLPGQVKARRLRMETGIIATLAQRLTRKLQAQDALAGLCDARRHRDSYRHGQAIRHLLLLRHENPAGGQARCDVWHLRVLPRGG
jgi:farnesyl-diphosphate farnesyltransferase